MREVTKAMDDATATPRSVADVSAFDGDPAGAFAAVRSATLTLCDGLETEDYGLQSMEDCSPVKWHLAHTTWFFETFVLGPNVSGYEPHHPAFGYLFNSYYETVGRMHPRPARGLLSRPTVAEVYRYRAAVDRSVAALLAAGTLDEQQLAVVEIGLHHEQQHQELILTDLKHGLSCNPMMPVYCSDRPIASPASTAPLRWVEHPGGVAEVGHRGRGFGFDNEGPRHRVFLEPFALASRLVTCAEYIEFMADGGYRRPELWLSEGWATVQREGWSGPLYWEHDDGWQQFTLHGSRPIEPNEPVCHLSLYEADAYARWTGYRLPTEFEWEVLVGDAPVRGNFVETRAFHPTAAEAGARDGQLQQAFGDVWEWTRSAYAPYPAYRTPAGALGEYNGKFMCNQMVLRGGSCATPRAHVRATYRNFFHPHARWQFSGLRLARDP